MARGYTAEYVQWLEENNFSPEDEKLILKTTTGRMIIWLILSCVPTVNFFVMPLLMNAWSWRKIIKQKSFEPRPGILYSLFALAMYITFILIIPWILWGIVKRGQWGCGIRGLIRKGKIGNGSADSTSRADDIDGTIHTQAAPHKKGFPWVIVILVVVVLIAVLFVVGLTEQKEPTLNTSVYLPNYLGQHLDAVTSDLHQRGFTYTITYVTDPDQDPGTVIGQTPAAGTILDSVVSVELAVVSDMVQVPDFSTTSTVEEITSLAQQHGLTVNLLYTDEAAGLTFDSIPEGMVIDHIYANYAPGAEVSPGTEITVTVCLSAQYALLGDWYFAEYMYGSLYLTQYTFLEDGTFTYYYMGYIPVDYETELYTYGTYWDGAMGADSYEGTYQILGEEFTLFYNYWNWETDSNDYATRTHRYTISDGALHIFFSDADHSTKYLPGTQPDRDAPVPVSITGSWYAFGTPVTNDFGDKSLDVHTFYLFADGSFKSNRYSYMNSGDGWYFPGAGSTLVGEYTFDGSSLVLNYTTELVPIYNNDGDKIDTESIPFEQSHCITVTMVDGIVTEVICDSLSLTCFVQYDPSPYVNVDIMGLPLNHANQLYP